MTENYYPEMKAERDALAAMARERRKAMLNPTVEQRAKRDTAERHLVQLPDSNDVRELADAATPAAIRALVDVVENPHSTAGAKISAANSLLDRAHGKAHQSTTVQGGVTYNIVSAIPAPPNSNNNNMIDVTPKVELEGVEIN